jgi:hypothetical protein
LERLTTVISLLRPGAVTPEVETPLKLESVPAARPRRHRAEAASFAVPTARSVQSPWTAEDLLRWAGLWVVGLVLLGVGWYQASGKGSFGAQVAPTDLAVAGAIVVCVANVVWILNGRRAVGRRMHALLAPIEQLTDLHLSARATAAGESNQNEVLVAGPGTRHYHRASCQLAAGRNWPALSGVDLAASDRTACGVCRPLA